MPTFYQIEHYNASTQNYRTLGYRTSLASAENFAKRYMEEVIGAKPEFRKWHCVRIFKQTAIGSIYFPKLAKTIE